MITKEQIAEAAEQYAEQGNSAWTNDYNGFVAGANFVLQNLQQCNVSGSLPCHHNFVQKDTYWKSCTHCGMLAPLGQ